MNDAKVELVRHARKIRSQLEGTLPNGIGNTIDALCDALEVADTPMTKAKAMRDTPTEAMTRPIIGIENRTAQEVFDIMVDRIRAMQAARSETPDYSEGASADAETGSHRSDEAPSGLRPSGFDPARMTPPDIWGGSGFEVHDAYDEEEGRVEMGQVPRWHVMVNGVGSWPVAYFYEEGDAELWSRTMNAAFASCDRSGEAGETTQIGSTEGESAVAATSGETPTLSPPVQDDDAEDTK